MSDLRTLAAAWLAAGRPAIVVEVSEALGSTPRGVGTRMLVTADASLGTIGGGHLEWRSIATARALLAAEPTARHRSERVALGPTLGQCCGGSVTLAYTPLDTAALARWPADAPRFHLQLYGAGHVGRAIVRALLPLNVRIDWIDDRDDEFPADTPWASVARPADAEPSYASNSPKAEVRRVCVDAVEAEVVQAPPGAFYLVLTHRHDLDLRIGEAILQRGDFGFFGLIGSATKKQRFVHRFEQRGIAAERIARMVCPIGLAGIDGKEPEVIAASVVAQLLLWSSAASSSGAAT